MKNLLNRRTALVTIVILLSFCFLFVFSAHYSKAFAGGDCCANCPDYCHCDASCSSSCTAYKSCGIGHPACPGDGTKCCLCDSAPI